MAAEVENTASLGQNGNVNGTSELTGAALLVVVGEPFSAEHREQILERITKGFKCWDVEASGCDINSELQSIATAAPAGEEGPNGERIVHQQSDCLQADILINPQVKTVKDKVKSLLLSPRKYKLIVYSGHAFEGTGEWILQDDRFSYPAFASIVKDADVENALKQHPGSSLNIYTYACGEWSSNKIAKESYSKILDVSLNAGDKLGELTGVVQFTAYLSYFIKVKNLKELLRASDVVGSIRFSKPTMYIFPGCQGDSALFGISGFNLLVNAGYNRKACFWDFTRHLDRIDAFLLTHLGADNILSVSTMMERKAIENVHPEIGFTYFNASDKIKHSPNGDTSPENGGSHKAANLLVNLVEEGGRLVENMRLLNTTPHPCHLTVQSNQIQPINLYHKVGHGSLDLYVLNPQQDGKEMKDFLAQWSKRVDNFTNSKSVLKASGRDAPVPLPDMLSICALLVWRPASTNENITRILFPGNTPQQKIFEGLDRLKNIDIFQQAGCQPHDLKAGNKKPAGKAPAKSAPKASAPAPKRPTSTPISEKPKAERATKEVKNKKETVSANNKVAPKKEKKSPASTPSSKATPTPEETATPIDSPSSVTLSDIPAEQQSPEPKAPAQPPTVTEAQPQEQHQQAEESLVDLSIPAEPEVAKTASEVSQNQPAPLVDNSLVDLSQDMFSSSAVKAESADMPEADQDFAAHAEPELEHAVEPVVENRVQAAPPKLDSPEPLPDPNQFDPTSFVSSQKEEEHTFGAFSHDDFTVGKEQPFDPEPQRPEPTDLLGDEPLIQEQIKPVMEEQPESHPIEDEPLVDVTSKQAEFEEPRGNEEILAAQAEEAFQAPVIAGDSDFMDKQQLREMGIYDDVDEKDIDTTEAAPLEAQQPLSNQLLEEMGIYDREEPESQQLAAVAEADLMDQLKDQGVCFGDEDSDENEKDAKVEPEADSHTHSSQDEGVCGESETESQDLGMGQDLEAHRGIGEQIAMAPGYIHMPAEEEDVGREPEADQAAYQSEVPQGLPSPQEPVLLPPGIPSADYDDPVHQKYAENGLEFAVSEPCQEERYGYSEDEDQEVLAEEDAVQRAQRDEINAAITAEQDSVSDNDSLDQQEDAYYRGDVPDAAGTEQDKQECNANAENVVPVDPFLQEDEEGIMNQKEVESDKEIEQAEVNQETLPESDKFQREEDDHIPVNGPAAAVDLVDLCDVPSSQEAYHLDSSNYFAGVEEPLAAMDPQPSPGDGPVADFPPQAQGGSNNPFNIMDEPQGFSLQNQAESSTNPFLGVSLPEALQSDVAFPVEDTFGIPPQLATTSTNPFELPASSTSKDETSAKFDDPQDRDSLEKEQAPASQQFDPLSSWGEPMGLPAPPPPAAAASSRKPAAKGPASASQNGPTKTTPRRPDSKKTNATSPTKETASKKPAASANATTRTSRPAAGEKKTAAAAAPAAKKPASSPTKTTRKPAPGQKPAESTAKTRPATAPAAAKPDKAKSTAAKRPASAATGTKSAAAKPAPAPQLTPVTPFYVDLTYVPAHGDPNYSDIDFFRRIRARYYVISALSPPPSVFNALLEAKQTWEDKDLEVTILPTYDNDTLRHWMGLHRDELANLKIDVAPSVSRCTIQLQDHETSCSAYRLEF